MTRLFDLMLGLGMLVAALGAMWSRSLFRAVVLFVVFGLLVALAWVRLEAPDVALAEAAIGAGLTGALLLDAVGHLRRVRSHTTQPDAWQPDTTPPDASVPDA